MKKIILLVIFGLFTHSIYSQPLESDTVDILNYSINLDIIYLSKHSISGYANLKIVPKVSNLNRLKLDLLKMNVDSVLVNNQSQSWTYNDTLLKINLQSSYSITDTIETRVYYHGSPVIDPTGWGGFYFSSDTLYAFNLGVGFGDNPHNYGRVFFPCLDDFHDRATYDFYIRTKSTNMAVCNGTLMNISTDTLAGISEYNWQLHNTIPTYLASVAVGPYVVVADTFNSLSGQIPIQIYVPSNKVNAAIGTFSRLKQILQAFEWAYGPYRWERVGYVAVPFNSGAMEHSTNIAIGLGYINGANTYESLYAHELSHQWFGDLVTTNSAPEMWINEGWAVFSENLYKELIDGKTVARNEMRTLLKNVILHAHSDDGGYYSLANLPHDATYGTTAYDKGATVAHSLRGYLGDSLFFTVLHDYFNLKAFSYVSNNDFKTLITNSTGIDASGFFDAWVNQPGFCHFAVDSFSVLNNGNQYIATVNLRQKLRHKNNPAVNNRITVRFADQNWNFADRVLEFSGFTGSDTANLNFQPHFVFTDPDGVLADATSDYYETIKTTGIFNYADAYFKIDTKKINDSALLFITHHWVAPDTDGTNLPGLTISGSRYWSVEGIFPTGFNANGQFFYSKTGEFDPDIITSSLDSLVILYRPSAGKPWQSVNFSRQGLWSTGWMIVDNLLPGEYTLAVWDAQHAGISNHDINENWLNVFPNPAIDYSVLEINYQKNWSLQIVDIQGKILDSLSGTGSTKLNLTQKKFEQGGVYFLKLFSEKGETIATKKLVWIE